MLILSPGRGEALDLRVCVVDVSMTSGFEACSVLVG